MYVQDYYIRQEAEHRKIVETLLSEKKDLNNELLKKQNTIESLNKEVSSLKEQVRTWFFIFLINYYSN